MDTPITPHMLYQEYGADIEGVDSEYDPVTKITAFVAIRLHFPLNNTSEVLLFIHHHGDPPLTAPVRTITDLSKGEGVACNKEEEGLRVEVNGHKTGADPNPHPPGTRLTTIETFTIPNVFV